MKDEQDVYHGVRPIKGSPLVRVRSEIRYWVYNE